MFSPDLLSLTLTTLLDSFRTKIMESCQYSRLPFAIRIPPGRPVKHRRRYRAKTTRIGWNIVSAPYGHLARFQRPPRLQLRRWAMAPVSVDHASRQNSNALHLFSTKRLQHRRQTAVSGAATLNFAFSSPQVSNKYLQRGFFFGGGGDNPLFVDRGGVRGFDSVFSADEFSAANPHFLRTARGARLA